MAIFQASVGFQSHLRCTMTRIILYNAYIAFKCFPHGGHVTFASARLCMGEKKNQPKLLHLGGNNPRQTSFQYLSLKKQKKSKNCININHDM